MPLPPLHALLPLPLAARKPAARRAALPRAHLRALLSPTRSPSLHLSRYSTSALSTLHLRILPTEPPHPFLRLAPLRTARASAVWRALHLPDRHDLRHVPAAPTPHRTPRTHPAQVSHLVVCSLSALRDVFRAVHRAIRSNRHTSSNEASADSAAEASAARGAWELASAVVLSHAVQHRLRVTGARGRKGRVRWACEWMMREEGGGSADLWGDDEMVPREDEGEGNGERFLVDLPLRIARGVAVRVNDGVVEIRVDRTKALRLEKVRVRREREFGVDVLRAGARGRSAGKGAVVEAARRYERLGKAVYLD